MKAIDKIIQDYKKTKKTQKTEKPEKTEKIRKPTKKELTDPRYSYLYAFDILKVKVKD